MGPNEIILLRAISLLHTENTVHINTSGLTHIQYNCTLYISEWGKQLKENTQIALNVYTL